MKIKVSVIVSDWFEDNWIEFNEKKFTFFTLESHSLLWTLHGYTGTHTSWGAELVESFDLAPGFDARSLIEKLDIREIKSHGGSCRSIESLFRNG